MRMLVRRIRGVASLRGLLVMIAASFLIASQAYGDIVNGSFETGNLAGWTVSGDSQGEASVVTNLSVYDQWTGQLLAAYDPPDGSYFALLKSRGGCQYKILSQPFTAEAGQMVSGWVFFNTNDYQPFDDDGYVRILNVANLFAASVSTVGDRGRTPWQSFRYTFETSGNYVIEAGVTNVGDCGVDSDVGLDGIRLTPSGLNMPPLATSKTYSCNESESPALILMGMDADGDSLTYSIVSQPSHGIVTLNGNVAVYTPFSGFVGEDQFTFKVNDGKEDSAPAVARVYVIDQPAIAKDQHLTIKQDQSVTITLTTTYPGAFLSFYVLSPHHGTVTGDGGAYVYTPAAGYVGEDSFMFSVYDWEWEYETWGTVTITIGGSNEPPVAVGQSVVTNEGEAATITLTGIDPDNDPLTYSVVTPPEHGALTGAGNNLTYTPAADYDGPDAFTFKVNDGTVDSGPAIVSLTVLNLPPVITSIAVPLDPVAAGRPASVSVSFTDPGVLDTHTATIAWGDGTTSDAVVSEPGSALATHVYGAAGVYSIGATVEDGDGGVASGESPNYLVVYDTSAGFVTGGGWILSPAGAFAADPALTGKATFGFVAKYQRGATVPTGNTEFQFQVADFSFRSTSYDWLVIAGARAQYKGAGTVNGAGDYAFMLTVVDGQIPGGGGFDKFRIRIWDRSSGGLAYDNQHGADDTATPSTLLGNAGEGGGSITIHAP